MSRCRGPRCRAEVLWTRTPEGRKVLLTRASISHAEACAEPRGVFFLDDRERAIAWYPVTVAEVGELYRAHWGTCPDRDTFREHKHAKAAA